MGILSWRGAAAGILLMVGLLAGGLPSKADPPPPAKAHIGIARQSGREARDNLDENLVSRRW